MVDIEYKVVLPKEALDKVTEIYSVMIDNLYRYFVTDRGEARLDTITSVMVSLAPFIALLEEPTDQKSTMEEVDLI